MGAMNNTTDLSRSQILEMVANGQLSVQEAAGLLSQSNRPKPEAPEPESEAGPAIRAEAELGDESGGSASRPATTAGAGTSQGQATSIPAATVEPAPGDRPTAGPAHWFRVRVSDLQSGRPHVLVNIPLSWARFGLRLGKWFTPEVAGVSWNELVDPLERGVTGRIIDVTDWDDGQRVEIYVD